MKDRILLGIGRWMIPVPRPVWRQLLASNARKIRARTRFMGEDHHRVRDFVVTELPRVGAPLAPEAIGKALDLPVPRVVTLLDELEQHLTFLFRNERGEVTWAYPVTVDETPHRAHSDTGEDAYSP